MTEIRNKRLTLFILEILLLQRYRNINEYFVDEVNNFIYQYYEDNKELFSLLFDTEILEQFMKENYQIVSVEILMSLIHMYNGFQGYEKLIDEVGYEVDQKINVLSIMFLEYYNELIKLKYAEPITIYQKILQ